MFNYVQSVIICYILYSIGVLISVFVDWETFHQNGLFIFILLVWFIYLLKKNIFFKRLQFDLVYSHLDKWQQDKQTVNHT